MYSPHTGIREIDIEIHRAEIHGLIGVNGAGKTTMIKVMLGLLAADQGNVWFSGLPAGYRNPEYRQQLSYVPDDEVLLEHLTPREIVRFVGRAYRLDPQRVEEKAQRLFRLLSLKETDVSVDGFSRGMRKKVQICAALVVDCKLLILDEPTAGLDPNTIYLLKQLLIELQMKGVGVVVSTHDLGLAQELCGRVTLIDQGQILLSGLKDPLLLEHRVTTVEALFVAKTLNPSLKEAYQDVVRDL